MALEDLGEFGLIDRIVARLGAAAARDITVPPGDDAAAWAVDAGVAVATVDTLAEGTHWRRDTMSFADVGWRAVATSISDLAATGAEPGFLLISAELGPSVELEDVDAFADGVAAACECYGVRVAGGNVAGTPATSFSTTAFGTTTAAGDGSPVLLRRDRARPGDLVAVSGVLGASAAGLAMIEARRADEPEAEPLVRAHRRPQARIELGRAAVEAGVTCAIDISDGLLQDLGHVARASRVGIEVDAGAVPLHPSAEALLDAERARELALRGGEDYELALTAPTATLGALTDGDTPLTTIGRVVEEHPGEVVVFGSDGRPMEQPSGGWDQLRTARG
ncbi:MAG: thiamine-phosphate kinase [Chloroflexi bacterium]|nr:thiamine-phosphate kinase [Chloroflexota bacterium]